MGVFQKRLQFDVPLGEGTSVPVLPHLHPGCLAAFELEAPTRRWWADLSPRVAGVSSSALRDDSG